jgi:hypothetical protein
MTLADGCYSLVTLMNEIERGIKPKASSDKSRLFMLIVLQD